MNVFDKIERVDCILTDPPYSLSHEQMTAYFAQFRRLCDGPIIIFCQPENQWPAKPDQYLFWVKPISTKNTSRRYSRFVEMVQVYGGESYNPWNNGRHWSQYTNVAHDLVDDKEHPYAKPLSLMLRLVRNHTKAGDVVLDPFMGSGTTGKACQLADRGFIGIEKDRERFEVAEGWLKRA